MRGLNKHYFKMPKDYIEELYNKGKREKAKAFMEYCFDLEKKETNSIRFYQKSWCVKSTKMVFDWIVDFKYEIGKYNNSWALINLQQDNTALKQDKQKINTLKTDIVLENTTKTGVSKNIETGNKQNINKDYNNINNNNIYVDSEKSTSITGAIEGSNKSKKTNGKYNPNFEYLWHLYDKKSSNKKRAFNIYLKRFKNTNLELIEKSIIKYKENIDLRYQKDFDGFLNGLIDTYLPKKAFLIDKNDKKHIGIFYDYDNTFIINEKQRLEVDSDKLASLIQTQRFGYLND